MTKSLVSINVPVYNVEDYLERCVNSLLSQTYKHFEIILVDDGSEDSSGALCDKLTKIDKRIRAIHQSNRGLSAARNAGIKNSNGEFLLFVDSDDYVDKNFVKTLLDAINNNDADIAVCGYQAEDTNGKLVRSMRPGVKTLSGQDALVQLLTKQLDTDVITWNKLYKAGLFKNNNLRFPLGKQHEDNLTTYKLFAISNRIAYIDDLLYHYTQRNDSIMGERNLLRNIQMKETAAKEAATWLGENGYHDNQRVTEAVLVSLLLARLFCLNSIIKAGKTNEELWRITATKIKGQEKLLRGNQFFGPRLKLYVFLLKLGRIPYASLKSILMIREKKR